MATLVVEAAAIAFTEHVVRWQTQTQTQTFSHRSKLNLHFVRKQEGAPVGSTLRLGQRQAMPKKGMMHAEIAREV